MISPDLTELPKKLFETSSIEDELSIDQDFQSCYEDFYKLLEGKSEIEIENQLNSQATLPDGKPNLNLMKGLIHSILINKEHAVLNLTRIFRSIPSSREHFADIISPLLTHYDFHKIHFYCRKQLIWIINNITGQVYNIELLYHLLIRNIPACKVDPLSISFCNEVVDLFSNQREMIIKMPSTLKFTVYVLFCMINDHKNQIELRRKEVDMVLYFLKSDFMTCISIGREFIRVLHNILQVPEIADLWANMVTMPRGIHPNFHGIQQILHTPTTQEIFELRISFKMANFIQYLLHNVTIEQTILYVPLFKKIFLNDPEMEGFYPDIIRYLVGCQSCKGSVNQDSLTRYNVIIELISQLQSMTGISDCQLALVFDWLFFQGGVDTYFNIEPAALIICNFLNHYPHISNTLLEFLFESSEQFYQDTSSYCQAGLVNGMHALCSYGVISTLDPLFEFNVDPKLKKKVYDTFKTFLSEKVLGTFDPNIIFNGPGSMRPPTPTQGSPSPGPPHTPSNEPFEMEPNWGSDDQGPNFSPTHEDINEPNEPNEPNETEDFYQHIQNGADQQHTPENMDSPIYDNLNLDDESLVEYRELLGKFKELSVQANFSEATLTMGELIEKILKEDDLNPELINALSVLISDLTYVEVSSETIEKQEGEFISPDIQDILTPIIDQTIDNIDDEETFGKLSELTWKLASNSKHLSYRILIQLIRQNEDISKAYKTFSRIIGHWPDDFNQIICNIFDDLCCTSLELFDCLLPQFYRYIPECVGDLNLILVIIQNLNPSITNNIISRLSSNRLIIFGPKIQFFLSETLQWDPENQESLWELLAIESYGKLGRVNGILKEFVPFLIGPNAANESDVMIDCEVALRSLVPLIASIHPNFDTLEQLFLLSHSMYNNQTYMIFSDILSIWSRNSNKMLVDPFKKLFDQILEFNDLDQEDHPIMQNIFSFVYIVFEWWSMYYSNEAILEDINDDEENDIISMLNIQEMLKNIISKFNLASYFPNLFEEN